MQRGLRSFDSKRNIIGMELEVTIALFIGFGLMVLSIPIVVYIYSLKGYRNMYINGSEQKRFFCYICQHEKAVSQLDGFIPTKHLKNPTAFVYETIARRQEPPLHCLVCPSCQTPQLLETVANGYFPALGQKKKDGKTRNLDERLSAHLKLKNNLNRSSFVIVVCCLGLMAYIGFWIVVAGGEHSDAMPQ